MDTRNPFGNVEFLRKPSGVFLLDGKEVAHTVKCCHHGGHFLSRRGSGIRRGYCLNCKAITCGRPACDVCIPFEERLNLFEENQRNNGIAAFLKTRYKDELRTLLAKKLPLI